METNYVVLGLEWNFTSFQLYMNIEYFPVISPLTQQEFIFYAFQCLFLR